MASARSLRSAAESLVLMITGLLMIMGLLGAGAWWFLRGERSEAETSVSRIIAERDRLESEKNAVIEQREELSRRVAILGRSAQVKSQAYANVATQLAELQREIFDLKEEVAFYRGIVSEDKGGVGVRIQRLVLEQDGDERDFRFRVVLTRGKQGDKVIAGTLQFSVDGDQDGVPVRLPLDLLAASPVAKLQFSFKHFQRLEGRLHLPERFIPKRVVIQIDTANSNTKPIRESFAWSIENS